MQWFINSQEDPFTPFFSDNLFNMARYLFHIIPKQVPEGVSMVYILQTLAKQGRSQGAFKLSRLVYSKLHSYHIPPKLRTQIQMGDLTVRSKPFSDAEVNLQGPGMKYVLNFPLT